MLLKSSCAILNCFSCVLPFVRLCTVAHCHQKSVPLSTGFSRQEYWSGLPCSSPGDLTDQGMESASLISPALAGEFFTTSTTRESLKSAYKIKKSQCMFSCFNHEECCQVSSISWEHFTTLFYI